MTTKDFLACTDPQKRAVASATLLSGFSLPPGPCYDISRGLITDIATMLLVWDGDRDEASQIYRLASSHWRREDKLRRMIESSDSAFLGPSTALAPLKRELAALNAARWALEGMATPIPDEGIRMWRWFAEEMEDSGISFCEADDSAIPRVNVRGIWRTGSCEFQGTGWE